MKTLKFILVGLVCLCAVLALKSQDRPGSLRGTVTDAKSGETIPFANIQVLDSTGSIVAGGVSDIDGKYNINPIKPQKYTVTCSFTGYSKVTVKEVRISPNTPTIQDFKLRASSAQLQEVVITYEAPLIDKVKTSSITTHENIAPMAVRDITSVRSQSAGVIMDSETSTNIRGARSEGFYDHERKQANFEREAYSPIAEIPFRSADEIPLSTFSSDVDAASYSNIRRFITDGYLPPPGAVRIEEMINYFNYDYPQPKEGEVFSMTTELGECPWNKKHRLLRVGIKTADIPQEDLPDNNLVFLIDVSGSMQAAHKLDLLKRSMKMLVDNLGSNDRVAMVVYAGAAGVVLEPTKGTDKNKIMTAIDRLSAGGSTAGGAGIKLAYKLAEENFDAKMNNRVILATDGDFNVGLSSDAAMVKLIEEKRETGVFLTVLGFGTGNYQDSKMEKLADHGNGNYAYIDNMMEAHKVLVAEMGASLHTVAKDTKFQIEFNPGAVQAYRLIGYENRMLNDEDFNDDTKDAGDVGSGHAVTAVYEIIPLGVHSDVHNPGLDSLKYQKQRVTANPEFSGELATLKIRYKKPDGEKSVLRTKVVPVEANEKASEDFNFICAIMEVGMLLRDSDYKGESSFEDAILLAKAGKGEDINGYRSEFIRLAELAERLDRSRSIGSR